MIAVLEIALAIIVVFGLFFVLFKTLWPKYKVRKSITPLQAKNLEKEKQFLANLLEDVRINTSEWFVIDDVIVMGQGRLLANDKKNIGIVYGNQGGSATILLNIEKLNEPFSKDNEDTVKLSVQGSHVKSFLDTAEQLIDKRGNEIAFFESELGKRL